MLFYKAFLSNKKYSIYQPIADAGKLARGSSSIAILYNSESLTKCDALNSLLVNKSFCKQQKGLQMRGGKVVNTNRRGGRCGKLGSENFA